MKKIFGIIFVIIICIFIGGCSIKKNEVHTAIEDLSEIEQIYIDEYGKQNDSNSQVSNIIKKLGEKGYIAVDKENKIDMTETNKLLSFIESQKAGSQETIKVFQVSYEGGFTLYNISTNEGNVNIEQCYYTFKDNKLNEDLKNEFSAKYFNLTDEGYLFIEGYIRIPELYVMTLCDEDVHIALRVYPLDKKCKEFCNKYFTRQSYSLNNMFITNWNEGDFTSLDFYDVFEKFYQETYDTEFPYVANDNLSVVNEYEISAVEFENVVKQHFQISNGELHKMLKYNANSNSYIFRPRIFGEYDYCDIPYPEVQSYEENDDGTLTLLVNAVFPNDNTSKLFTHKVKVKEQDGKIYYLSNEIVDDNEINLWWHAEHISDEEWNKYYAK